MICPVCKVTMHKAGFGWSGSKKVQRYRCQKCGRVVQRKQA
uniref:Putative transcription factor zinc-finger domain n=1 Tax=viral metagenome TaxID=1070528 RepID=A0A6M3KLA7_9ZZZZ